MRQTAKLFQNGRSQAVRLPSEFRFEGTEVEIRRDERTGAVMLFPIEKQKSWDDFFRLRDQIPACELKGFMEDREQGLQVRDDPLA